MAIQIIQYWIPKLLSKLDDFSTNAEIFEGPDVQIMTIMTIGNKMNRVYPQHALSFTRPIPHSLSHAG